MIAATDRIPSISQVLYTFSLVKISNNELPFFFTGEKVEGGKVTFMARKRHCDLALISCITWTIRYPPAKLPHSSNNFLKKKQFLIKKLLNDGESSTILSKSF